jgi:hypothetical protein
MKYLFFQGILEPLEENKYSVKRLFFLTKENHSFLSQIWRKRGPRLSSPSFPRCLIQNQAKRSNLCKIRGDKRGKIRKRKRRGIGCLSHTEDQ